MINNLKISKIRRYLHENKKVFVNNIIVTLPDSTKILDGNGNTINPAAFYKTEQVLIQIPQEFNVIGIIDGQHRVFSYHEGGKFEDTISILRKKQNLLATGIIYPKSETKADKIKFEANLFLEINSNQTGAKSDLKQAIELLLRPFSSDAIAKAVLNELNNHGPLGDVFERHFYDKGKIKTSSIVSFALKPIVKLSGKDSFYHRWRNVDKKQLPDKNNERLLEEYIKYCVKELNIFFSAVKNCVKKEQWTTDRNQKNRALSVTVVNGLIICLRKMIETRKISTFPKYQESMKAIKRFPFGRYKSSQYSRMAEDIYKEYFG